MVGRARLDALCDSAATDSRIDTDRVAVSGVRQMWQNLDKTLIDLRQRLDMGL
jgi:hypothetical protein